MTNDQKAWLLKTESDIRHHFTADPFDDPADPDAGGRLLDQVGAILKKANENQTVKRWLYTILNYYDNRSRILQDSGALTTWERLNESMEENKRLKKQIKEKGGDN